MHRYVILHEKFDCGINFCETFLLFNNDILGRHKQDLVKTLEIYFYSSQDHEMFISWKFQLNSFIFKQNIKCRKGSFSNEPRCIYMNWNNFWTKIFFWNGFQELKGTIKLYTLAENEENP